MREDLAEPAALDWQPPDRQIVKSGELYIHPVKSVCELFCFDWIAGYHVRLEPVPIRQTTL